MSEEEKLEEEIIKLKLKFQSSEEGDPLYMGTEMQELNHKTMYVHTRLDESLGHLLIRHQLAPAQGKVPVEAYQYAFNAGTTIATEVPYYKKVELVQETGQITGHLGNDLLQVNNLRKWFSHPGKFQKKLEVFKTDRTKYKGALEDLDKAFNGMNVVFEEFLEKK